jgi:peptide/nickel transport system permease protein
MARHLLGRLAEALVALLLMSLVIFLLSRVTGDPVALLLADDATEADRLDLIRELHLDRPYGSSIFRSSPMPCKGISGVQFRAVRNRPWGSFWNAFPHHCRWLVWPWALP